MGKIETVVNHCSECRYFRVMKEECGNTLYCGLCTFPESSDDNTNSYLLVGVAISLNGIISLKNGIHMACPLEDYNGLKDCS